MRSDQTIKCVSVPSFYCTAFSLPRLCTRYRISAQLSREKVQMTRVPSIFKYFGDNQHLENFLQKGEVFFNTLSYFLSCEDLSRRDISEDANVYMPSKGLEISITATNQKLKDQRGLISRVKRPDRIFVFCTSLELSENLFRKFCAAGCDLAPNFYPV